MPRVLLAPAKLNLYLHVTGRRQDGYHLLDSLVAFADIGDELSVAAAAELSLRIAGPFAADLTGDVQGNLVWRAATLLARQLGRPPAAALTLVKNLPIASGIGGGSSDAATTLRLLLSLWNIRDNEVDLRALAGVLGADVPVCLVARSSWLAGIGEQVEPAPALPETHLILVNPGLALPTPSVFATRSGAFSAPAPRFGSPSGALALAALLAERRNDLTTAAIGLAPVIGTVLTRLAALEGALLARMSGSGATCFALFASAAAAAEAAARLHAEAPGWWVASGRLI